MALIVGGNCFKCGLCLDKCLARAIVVVDGAFRVGPGCTGCALCLELCPAEAVILTDGLEPPDME